MSTNAECRPNSTTAAEETGKTVVRQVFAEHERAVAARMEAWRARYRAQEDARRRLAQRFGTDLEKRWATDPNAPRVDAVSLLYAFLIKAGPAHLWSPVMEQAPKLERDDALAAAYMIHAARHDAREREVAVMRHILARRYMGRTRRRPGHHSRRSEGAGASTRGKPRHLDLQFAHPRNGRHLIEPSARRRLMNATNGALLDQIRAAIDTASREGRPARGRGALVETTGATDHAVRKALAELAATQRAGDDNPRTRTSTFVFVLGALVGLVVSADTSWRFFRDMLGVSNVPERIAMFAGMEILLIACGISMFEGVRRRGGTPGPARWLAWAICGASAYAAFVLSGPFLGTARVMLGPVLSVVALHYALGVELRSRGHRYNGTLARIGREMRERFLSRFGLADDERDALTRTRDRAARRVARLALAPQWTPFRQSRLDRNLRRSNAAHDPTARARMLAELTAIRHAGDLRNLTQKSPWKS
jgi:hypothetical protein